MLKVAGLLCLLGLSSIPARAQSQPAGATAPAPTAVPAAPPASTMAAIYPTLISSTKNHTCAVTRGGVRCWGQNHLGQLGNGSVGESQESAVQASGLLAGVTSVSVGETHACAIMSGNVWCWGDNRKGQLGDGTTNSSRVPVQVQGLPGAAQAIAVGGTHTCAIVDFEVYCWGQYELTGPWEIKPDSPKIVAPTKVGRLERGATAIAAATEHTCAAVNGAVWCWGTNKYGQLGTGNNQDGFTPVQAKDLVHVTALSANAEHTCAVADGEVYCWGRNDRGELGSSGFNSATAPERVSGLPDKAANVAIGLHHSCAALVNGRVWCWGDNSVGQLGRSWIPTAISALKLHFIDDKIMLNPGAADEIGGGVAQIGAGAMHSCAVYRNGAIRCWGDNSVGQLAYASRSILSYGRGTSFSSLPLPVVGLAEK